MAAAGRAGSDRPARVLDADGHVVEPAHVFEPWLSGGRVPFDLPDTTPAVPCGDFDLVTDQLANGFDPPSYLRAMDAQGIAAAVLYPSIGLFVPYLPELSPAESHDACRAYNDWIASYCDHDPARLAGVGLVPLADASRAAAEAERCAGLGLVGVLARPNHVYGRNLGDAYYDPLYDAVSGCDLVLAVHEGLGLWGPTIGSDRFTGFTARHALSHPMEQMAAMASLVLDGALERHAHLRVAFLESGTGWLPYWLDRLTEHIEWMAATETSGLGHTAHEYFERQCVISTEAGDGVVASTVRAVGSSHVMWASDYPHPDAQFPGAVDAFVANATGQGLAAGEIAAVAWTTPLRFYRLAGRFDRDHHPHQSHHAHPGSRP